MPDFTVLDARQMMPKIFTISKNISKKTISMPTPKSNQSGYQYPCPEGKDGSKFNKDFFAYSTDNGISYLLVIAKNQANTLIQFVGMQKLDNQQHTKAPHSSNEAPNLFEICSS
ncbi:hypothetical protein DFH28DRAFT_1139526 [Melampsora americana]|nr:hypothetical protein DFH28DRAFT_1139526 [Melampsora americana]